MIHCCNEDHLNRLTYHIGSYLPVRGIRVKPILDNIVPAWITEALAAMSVTADAALEVARTLLQAAHAGTLSDETLDTFVAQS